MRIDAARALGAYVRAEAYRSVRPTPEPEPAPVVVEESVEEIAEEMAEEIAQGFGAGRAGGRLAGERPCGPAARARLIARLLFPRRHEEGPAQG
ncbi:MULTISPECIES: hypothetical protein [Streptomyces]|uniref:Uncharacterized protein n=1 Tax=Streptomyces luteosporeus TaxID=173856 RepID=A0ABN3U416_9ACTN